MNRRSLSAILALFSLVSAQAPVRAYTLQYRDSSGIVARRWLARPIIVAFSSSLSSPPANIKAGSDVIGAARRALESWARVADIQFLETRSTAQTISPPNAGDRINLITVSGDNAALFGSSENPGRTRVFSDSGGAIVEADIALNPNQFFSSDGTPGTYDLESTFAHEVGHLLGLEHSAVIGATMQPRQAQNGLYGLPAFTQRTLAEDDIAGRARALRIAGRNRRGCRKINRDRGRWIVETGFWRTCVCGRCFDGKIDRGQRHPGVGRLSDRCAGARPVSFGRAEPGWSRGRGGHRRRRRIVCRPAGHAAAISERPPCGRPRLCDRFWSHRTLRAHWVFSFHPIPRRQ